MLLRASFLLILVYAAILLLLFLSQSRLVFLPHVAGRALIATPAEVGLDYREVWLQTEDGERLHAWWIPKPEARGVLHFSHGNAGNISHRLESVRVFHDLGLSVLIYDYRGYGQSSGRPNEAGLHLDAEAAWRWLLEESGANPQRIVLFGRSMGGAVAARLASRVSATALILESTFTSVPDIASEIYWWLPVRWLARIELNALEALGRSTQPTLIIHSRDDEIVPFRHALRLAEAAPKPSRLIEISGSHNTGFISSGALYRQALNEFLEQQLRD